MRRLLYVLLDGVGDRPHPELGGLTPLEAANTPNMDKLACMGISGLVHPVGRGIAPESDIAVFHMLGYEFSEEGYMGRGVVEAVGAGMDFKDGDLALRANFATVDEGFKVLDRRAGRDVTDEEGEELASAIKDNVTIPGVEIDVVHTVAHRVVVKFRVEGGLSANISNTDPAYQRIGGMGVVKASGEMVVQKAVPLDDDPRSRRAAEIVNEFTRKVYEVLKEHPINRRRAQEGKPPANILLMRDAGNTLPKIPKMEEKYGLSFAIIADMPVELGIGRITGMKAYRSKAVDDYEDKIALIKRAFDENDAVYVHIKGPDEPGHDGKPRLKASVIEEIDRRFFGPLLERIWDSQLLTVISADHATPCMLKAHSDDPVPVLYSASWLDNDGTGRFTEGFGRRGRIGMMRGAEVLPRAVNILKGL